MHNLIKRSEIIGKLKKDKNAHNFEIVQVEVCASIFLLLKHQILEMLLHNDFFNRTKNFLYVFRIHGGSKVMIQDLMAIATRRHKHSQDKGLHSFQIKGIALVTKKKYFNRFKLENQLKKIELPDIRENSEQCWKCQFPVWLGEGQFCSGRV